MAAPLDSLETAVNLARVRLNDAIASLAGDVLTDNQPFTLPAINGAWRRLQEILVDFGQSWFKKETNPPLTGIPAVSAVADPYSVQQSISWSGGVAALPQDLIAPLVLWERATGPYSFFPMDRVDNGLPAVVPGLFNRLWEWRNGSIVIPGATQSVDIRIRYAAFMADFVAAATTPFANQNIPIMRALNPFSWLICSEIAKARGDLDGQTFDQKAMESIKQMFDLDPMQAKSTAKQSEYSRMADQYSRENGPASEPGRAAA